MTSIEPHGAGRVTVTRVDENGHPVGGPVELTGVTDIRMPPAVVDPADLVAFRQAEVARVGAAAAALDHVRDRLADLGPAIRAAVDVMARALAPLTEARLGRARPGVEAQRSPYGPRRRR